MRRLGDICTIIGMGVIWFEWPKPKVDWSGDDDKDDYDW